VLGSLQGILSHLRRPRPAHPKVAASDVVVLGKTGIRTVGLAMGTGTSGSGHHSTDCPRPEGISDLLLTLRSRPGFSTPPMPMVVILIR